MDSISPKPVPSEALKRIAKSNRPAPAGKGLGDDHFVPVCKLHSRPVAKELLKRLRQAEIDVKTKHRRLWTQFFVCRRDLAQALELQETFLQEQPDVKRRMFSRDYDAFFLFLPFTLLAAAISLAAATAPQSPVPTYVFIAILTTGFSCMLFFERVNRQYRYQSASEFRLSELFGLTALAAVNLAVWLAVL